jgi:nucleoside-diphosphate-sugar epimerase
MAAATSSGQGAAKRLFCFGLGFSALTLAERLGARGWSIAGTVRTAEKHTALAARGIATHRFERGARLPDAARLLAGFDYILSSVPPDAAGDPVLDEHGADLAAQASHLRWVGYLSTTGVYGDRAGGWVDEASALEPTGERGRRRVAAERGWLALGEAAGLPVQLFRLAGIYGPGRNVIEQLRAGTAKRLRRPGQIFSRIHVEDIATVLEASMAKPRPGGIYNLCDDDPAAPGDVVAHAAELIGIEPPPEQSPDDAALSPMARSFWDDNKRVRNDRIKSELGVRLGYPSYREGLAAILRAEADAAKSGR